MSEELIGQIVNGEVTNVTNFGAFVKLENGEEGLVHISEVANQYVTEIGEFVALGDKVKVKVLKKNVKGKLELSIKQAEDKEDEKGLFLHKRSRDEGFEDKLTLFMKKAEEKQIDIRRNIKHKQGISKKKK